MEKQKGTNPPHNIGQEGRSFYPFDPFPPEEPFDLKKSLQRIQEIAILVWKEKVKGIQFLGLSLFLGLIYLLGQPTQFTADLRLIPYQSGSGGSLGGLAGLAGLAGIKIPSSGSGQQGNVLLVPHYAELIKSHDFLTKIVDTPIYFSSLNKSVSYKEYQDKYQQDNWIRLSIGVIKEYTLGLPGKLLGLLYGKEQGSVGSQVPKGLTVYDVEYAKLLKGFQELILVEVGKETAIIDISVQLPDAYAAAAMVQLVAEQLKTQIIEFETKKDEEQVRYLGEQHVLAKERYQKAQRYLASYTDRNRGTYSALDQVGLESVQSDFTLAFQLYSNLSSELEAAKIKKAKDTPSFSIFQTATVPLQASSPRKGIILGSSLFLGILLFLVYFLIKRYDVLFPPDLKEGEKF